MSCSTAMPLGGTVLWYSYAVRWNCLMVQLCRSMELSYGTAMPLGGTVLWKSYPNSPWGSRGLRLPEFLDNRQGSRPHLPAAHFC